MAFKVPHEFREGELAYARQVNANFLAITEQLKEINSNKADIELSNIANTGIENIQKASLTRTIGEYVFSSLPLNNSCLHLLDGSILAGNGIYKQFVEYIADLYDSNSNYFINEQEWQTSVETYGVCAKFVYNPENNTVRLPKITGLIEGTTDIKSLGDLVEAGLPTHTHTRGNMNITGTIYGSSSYDTQTWGEGIGSITGAFSNSSTKTGKSISDGNTQNKQLVNLVFNASNSWTGSTSTGDYSTSLTTTNTVQPQTIKAFVYIVIATSAKTEVQIDIDNIATDINGKADRDLTNANNRAKILMSSMGMPSNKYIDLTLGSSGSSYTAPADGWFVFAGNFSETGRVHMASYLQDSRVMTAGEWYGASLAVAKGGYMNFYYTGTANPSIFRFYYTKGSESEIV